MNYKLFYPASLLPHKNHHLLLEPKLLDYLTVNNIQVRLTINEDQLLAKPTEAVICLGPLNHDDCIALLRESDALLFLSEFESLGLPLIEAVNARKPVISYDLPYCRELLGDSPYYILYESEGVNPICSALTRFLLDQPKPRQSLLVRDTLPVSTVWSRFLNAI